MTEEDVASSLKDIIEKVKNDTTMYPAKQKAVIKDLRNAKISISEDNEHYINKEKTEKIASRLMLIFMPTFLITMIIYSYGITGYIPRGSSTMFYISIVSFTIAFSNTMTAPLLFRLQQRIFTPKSAQ